MPPARASRLRLIPGGRRLREYSFSRRPRGNGIVQTASGFVSVVQVTNMPDGNGTFIDVTLITFLLNGNATTMTFCGDQRNQFPIDQFVRANFMPGQPCADIVTVVIGFR